MTHKETPPPCVRTESWQKWRLNDFETSERLCLRNTLTLTSPRRSPEYLPLLQDFPPFHGDDESRSDPKLWLRCESQIMTCPCESHDTPLPVQLYFNSKNKTALGICANQCAWWNTACYCKVVTKMRTFLNVKAVSKWVTLTSVPSCSASKIALLTKKYFQTACQRRSLHWVNIDSK